MLKTQHGLSPIEEVIADARAGRMFILVDDQSRENEGDLCIIGEHANAEAVNFYGKIWPWAYLFGSHSSAH
ncbi:MAG: hypothetical protein CM15mP100_5660 [Alphaproteobacteria bacterium]|nr:MAG: hypothetical protein CM15mP100_5660 [Alphaproteobacteria bacterium]